MIGEVALEGMEFYGHHGFYEEEQKIGNKYTVDIFMTLEITNAVNEDRIDGTINYERVYEIIAGIMSVKTNLLEYLAGKVIEKLKKNFSSLESVKVRVSKHNPPINGLCKTASVTVTG